MANQIIIDIGAVANDGTGDPLRTAFGYVNDNFSNIWSTGVANSNVAFSGNKIITVNTNGNLVLAPNGTGKVVANVDIVPNTANTRNLGALTNRWSTVYAQYLNVTNDVDFTGDVTIGGNLTVEGDTIQIGNITTDTKTIQLANTANTANAANGSGVTVGANDNIATMLYNSTSNTWVMNIGLDTPNIVVNNITSDDSTFVTVQDGLNVDGEIESAGNVTGNYIIGNGSTLTNITGANVTGTVPLTANVTVSSVLTNYEYIPALLVGNTGSLNVKAADSVQAFTFNPSRDRLSVGIVKTAIYVTGNIPLASTAGAGSRTFVSDADVSAWGNLYVGGAANTVPVWSNGTNWYIG